MPGPTNSKVIVTGSSTGPVDGVSLAYSQLATGGSSVPVGDQLLSVGFTIETNCWITQLQSNGIQINSVVFI